MLAYEFRVIVEKVSVTSQEVVKRDTLKIYDIKYDIKHVQVVVTA